MKCVSCLILMAVLINNTTAETTDLNPYTPRLDLSIGDFMYKCDGEALTSLSITEYGRCAGNFFDPRIPNPLSVLEPLSGERLQARVSGLVDFSDGFGVNELLMFFPNLAFFFIASVIEIMFNIVKYLVVFTFSFIKTYLIYFCLGFQVMLQFFNRGDLFKRVNNVHSVVFFMIAASILSLVVGGGWII